MPYDFSKVKKKLVSDLWLRAVIKAGSIRYPTRKRSKQLKMLTLTNADELSEIYVFTSNKVLTKENVVAWNCSLFKAMRLETELDSVIGKTRYENSVCNPAHEVRGFFPREIINLDFTSQDLQEAKGRIESELQSVEETIRIQSQFVSSDKEVFVIIYTTLIDSQTIDCVRIANASDAKVVRGWQGLNFTGFPNRIIEVDKKIEVVKCLLNQFSSKYGLVFDFEGDAREQVNRNELVYSIVGIVKKR